MRVQVLEVQSILLNQRHLLIPQQGCHQIGTRLSQTGDNLVDGLTGVELSEVAI